MPLTAAFGGLLSVLQGFDLGGLVVYLNYSKQVGQPLNQISQQMTTLLSALAGAERIFDVMDTQPEVDQGQVTLVEAEKDANGTLTPFSGTGHSHTWAWKTPRSSGMALVPVLAEGETLTELGQAVREQDGWKLLPPGTDSDEGIWVKVAPDGTLTQVEDLSALAGHGWAWKYPDHTGVFSLHLIRGTVRNVPGEDYYLTELRGAVRFSHVDFSYVPGKRILKDVSVYANPGQKIAFVGSTGAGKTTITNLINRFYEIEGGLITYDGIDVKAIRKDDLRRSPGGGAPGYPPVHRHHPGQYPLRLAGRHGRGVHCRGQKRQRPLLHPPPAPGVSDDGLPETAATWSQGQRQLLAIAQGRGSRPPVMILDEATSSIDTRTGGPHPEGDGHPDGGQDRVRHRPPPLHRPQLQLHRGH